MDELTEEWVWLVKHELRAKLEAIDKHMEECTKKFTAVTGGGSDLRSILLNSPHQSDSMLSTVTVDGDRISKAELNLKAKGHRQLRTTIKEHSPWKLKQIQDSANHFQRVRDLYAGLRSEDTQSQLVLRDTLEQLLSALHQTVEVLILPPITSAEQIFTSEKKSLLKPELPDDVVIHFHISAALLVLTVLTVTVRTGQKDFKETIELDSASWVGIIFEHGNIVYEVTGQVQVQAQVPWLQSVLVLLRETLELTQDLVDKVKVFDE